MGSMILKNVLLTGEPGVGKTTIIKAVLGHLPIKATGFLTEEICAGKTTKGINLITLAGAEVVVAHASKKSTYRVGKYGVDLKTFEDIVLPMIEAGLKQKTPLIVLDEIGKMECYSKNFRDLAIRSLDSQIPVLGSIQNFASPIINTIMNREDVVFIEVTTANRDVLADKIAELVKRLVAPSLQTPPKPKKKGR